MGFSFHALERKRIVDLSRCGESTFRPLTKGIDRAEADSSVRWGAKRDEVMGMAVVFKTDRGKGSPPQ